MTQNYFSKPVSPNDVPKTSSAYAIEAFLPPVCDALNDEQRECIAEIISTCRLLLEVGNTIYPTVHFGFETCAIPCAVTSGPTDDQAMQDVIEDARERAPDFALFVVSGLKKNHTVASAHYRLETHSGCYSASFSVQDSPANTRHKVLVPVHAWVKDANQTPTFLVGLDNLLHSLSKSERI